MCFTVWLSMRVSKRADPDNQKDLAAIRSGETPVPMPNTTVKTRSADGTALETVRESRWPPGFNKNGMDGGKPGRTLKTAYTKNADECVLDRKAFLLKNI